MFTVAADSLPLVYALHVYTYQRLGDLPCVNLFYAHVFKKDRTPYAENSDGSTTISPIILNQHPNYYVMKEKIRKNTNWSTLLQILHQHEKYLQRERCCCVVSTFYKYCTLCIFMNLTRACVVGPEVVKICQSCLSVLEFVCGVVLK